MSDKPMFEQMRRDKELFYGMPEVERTNIIIELSLVNAIQPMYQFDTSSIPFSTCSAFSSDFNNPKGH